MTWGAEVKYRLQEVGFVFQSYCLIPNLSAVENAMMPIELLNPKNKEQAAKAQKLLERVGIDQTRQVTRPTKLSCMFRSKTAGVPEQIGRPTGAK